MAAKFAVSLMALLGAVSAQTGYTNSSSIATTPTSSSASASASASTVTVGGVTYSVQTDTSYQGTVLNLARKRQADSSIQTCLNTCSADTSCVGTAYVSDTSSCIYYSAIDTSTKTKTPGTDFALATSRLDASSSANSTASATGSATRPGVSVSSNSTSSATGSSSRPAGITGGAGNSTSSRPTGSVSRTSSSSSGSSTPVPSSPSTIITINGVVFLLEIDISYTGITIDLTFLTKRAGQTLDDCLVQCADNAQCAGTAFDEATGTCTFYSSINSGSRTPTNGVDFATVLSRAGATGSGAGNNGTSGGNTTSPATNATAESFICPKLNGGVLVSSLEVTFAISCSEFLIGTTFDLLSTIQTKRQAIENGLPQTLSNCVDLCSLSAECVGTTFSETTGCSYYSAVSYATPLDGFDSAVKVQDNSGSGAGGVVTATVTVGGQTITTTTTVAAGTTTAYIGSLSTATVYTTSVITVTQYAGGATALPSGATVTNLVPISTITYQPSVSTITVPQNYAAPTVTVTVGNAPAVTVYQTVDGNGNVIGSSTAGAVAGGAAGGAGAAGSYPTVTVHDLYCPTSTAANVVFTTVYVR